MPIPLPATDAMAPATWVPCPCASSWPLPLATKSRPLRTTPARSGCRASTPVSSTATFVPLPRWLDQTRSAESRVSAHCASRYGSVAWIRTVEARLTSSTSGSVRAAATTSWARVEVGGRHGVDHWASVDLAHGHQVHAAPQRGAIEHGGGRAPGPLAQGSRPGGRPGSDPGVATGTLVERDPTLLVDRGDRRADAERPQRRSGSSRRPSHVLRAARLPGQLGERGDRDEPVGMMAEIALGAEIVPEDRRATPIVHCRRRCGRIHRRTRSCQDLRIHPTACLLIGRESQA